MDFESHRKKCTAAKSPNNRRFYVIRTTGNEVNGLLSVSKEPRLTLVSVQERCDSERHISMLQVPRQSFQGLHSEWCDCWGDQGP